MNDIPCIGDSVSIGSHRYPHCAEWLHHGAFAKDQEAAKDVMCSYRIAVVGHICHGKKTAASGYANKLFGLERVQVCNTLELSYRVPGQARQASPLAIPPVSE